MADVYLAVSQGPARFNKLVVLKCLRKRWLDEEGEAEGPRTDKGEFVEMFLEEARLAARLNHPNIVQTNEVGDEQGDYFIAMEYLEGQSLNRLMNRCWRKDREIPLELAILVLCDTLAGLHAAHELTDYDGKPLEIVHRDASPHNIFVTYEGQTKLVDFGIAKATNRSFETRTGILKGKIQYMAPEQARCGDVDRRADIFSIGVILWELLAKKRMWGGLPDIQILQKLVTEPVPKLEDVAPNAPAGLVKIVEKATASDAADRYATADEMRLELYNWAKVNLPPSTSKEMGTLTAELFADKRQMVKGIIENQFAQIRRGEEISLHVMDPNASTASLPKATGDLGEGNESSQPSHTGSRKGSGTPTLSSVARTNSESFGPAPRKRTGLWVALGVLAIGGVAVATTVGSKDTSTATSASAAEPPPAPPASSPAPVASSPAVATAPAVPVADGTTDKSNLTKLTITVNVEDAKIYIDDVLVTGNPYSGNFMRDGANHRVRAEADGHVTEKRLIPFDATTKDVTIELSEKPGAPPRPPPRYVPKSQPSAVATAPTATTPTPTSTGGPGKPPKRELDKTTDPWAKPKP